MVVNPEARQGAIAWLWACPLSGSHYSLALMQDTALVLAASLTYLVATVVYGAYLLRFAARFARVGRVVVAVGVVLNVGAAVLRAASGRMAFGTYDVFLVCSALAGLAFLAWEFRSHSPLLGSFLTPVLTMVTYSLHVFDYEAGFSRSAELGIITPVHIGSSILGFLVFAVSAGASALEVIQEYRLKTKRLKLMAKTRLPSLSRLSRISHRALIIGFPIYSVGMALGAIWFSRSPDGALTRHFIMALFSWVLYAVTLHARVVIKLKGRRAAILTLAAFVSALFVALLSILRIGG